jgi:hypothetical protein
VQKCKFALNFYLASRLKIRGAIPPLPFIVRLRQRQIIVLCIDAASCVRLHDVGLITNRKATTVLLVGKNVKSKVYSGHTMKAKRGS